MLDLVDNQYHDGRLGAFNAKIALYNDCVARNTDAALQSALLQEIYYFAKTLRAVVIDNNGGGPYFAILEWPGIDAELARRGKAGILDLAVEKSLIALQKSSEPLPSRDRWLSETQSNTLFRFMGWRSQSGLNLQVDLERLHALKASHQPDSLEYFYALQMTKAHLIHALNFELSSDAELHNHRLFLGYVNHEMDSLIQSSPKLALRYADTNTAARELGEISVKLTSESPLLMVIRGASQSEQIMAEWGPLLPPEAGYEVRLMRGNNNKNCMFTNERGEVIVVRAEILNANQTMIDTLRCTPINEYFLPEHGRFITEHYMLTISDYARDGDLRTNREKEEKFDHPLTIIRQATAEIGQLTQFCQAMLTHHAIHPDIKLANFLLDNGRVLIADKKTLVKITPEGKVRKGDIMTTAIYAPPEYKGAHNDTLFDADKYMSYQIGLSLYDYLVLPDEPLGIDEAYWSEKDLDFNKPIFKTRMGQEMQKLIEQATCPNPEVRLGVEAIMTSLQRIQRQSQSQAMVMREGLAVTSAAPRFEEDEAAAVSHKASIPLTPLIASPNVLPIEDEQDEAESTVRKGPGASR